MTTSDHDSSNRFHLAEHACTQLNLHMETLKHGNKEVHVCFESRESTCSMMKDAILPCFDIRHIISVYTHTLTNGIFDLFWALFFLAFFPLGRQLCIHCYV